jgi:hypothetical protein
MRVDNDQGTATSKAEDIDWSRLDTWDDAAMRTRGKHKHS